MVKKQYQEMDIRILVFETQDIVTFSTLPDSAVEDSTTHEDIYDSSNKWWK